MSGSLREEISLFLDGELPPERTKALEARLAADPEARAEFESLRRTVERLRALPREEAPAALERRLLASLDASGTASSAPRSRLLRFGGLLAAAALLLVTVLLYLDRRPPEPVGEVARLDAPREAAEAAPPEEARLEKELSDEAPAETDARVGAGDGGGPGETGEAAASALRARDESGFAGPPAGEKEEAPRPDAAAMTEDAQVPAAEAPAPAGPAAPAPDPAPDPEATVAGGMDGPGARDSVGTSAGSKKKEEGERRREAKLGAPGDAAKLLEAPKEPKDRARFLEGLAKVPAEELRRAFREQRESPPPAADAITVRVANLAEARAIRTALERAFPVPASAAKEARATLRGGDPVVEFRLSATAKEATRVFRWLGTVGAPPKEPPPGQREAGAKVRGGATGRDAETPRLWTIRLLYEPDAGK